MYLSLIVTFILLMGLVVAGIQNVAPVDFKFLAWTFQMSITGLIFFAALPGLVRQILRNRSFRKEMRELKQQVGRVDKHADSGENYSRAFRAQIFRLPQIALERRGQIQPGFVG
ncbi:MAG: hypothetical protein ACQET7_02720 [Thermodesulfobacteriota bacterium]